MSLEALTTEALAAIAAAQDCCTRSSSCARLQGRKASLQNSRKHLEKMDPEEQCKVQGAAIHAVLKRSM